MLYKKLLQVHDICDELVDHQGNSNWSSKLNCQVFVRIVLQRLGFKWPDELSFIDDDVIPMIVDWSIGFISCKANKFKKKGKLDDDIGDDDDSS